MRPLQPDDAEHGELDHLTAQLLQVARRKGFEPEEVLSRLERLVRPRTFDFLFVAEPEPAMRDILKTEIGEHVRVPVGDVEQVDPSQANRSLVVTLASRLPLLRGSLPRGVPCIPLRLRSVRGALEAQTRPAPDALISIVSRSGEIRLWSRAVLVAVGIDPACLCEVDAAVEGWQERLALSALVVTDAVTNRTRTARRLPRRRWYRIIADSSIAELKRVCAG